MNDFFLSLSFGLLRATVALMLATVAIGLLLRLARPNSPVIHRAGWLMALAVGWMFVGWTVEVPWHAPPAEASSESQQASDLVAQPLALTDGDIDPTGDLFALPGPEQIADTVAAPAPALEHDAAIPNAGVTSTAATTITAEDAREAETNRAGAFLDWHVALALAWLIGLVSIVLVWMVNYLRFVRSLAPALTADQLAPAQWRIQWRQLLDEHAVRREIPLVATRDAGPSLCRLPRGYVLLVPQETWEAAPANERLAILRHELAHYQRGDVWKSLAARLLALPHWFNPASWWCVRRFDEAAEWACDRAAVDDLPAEQFAKVLLHLGSARWRHTFLNPAARGHGLATRVRRLLSGDARRDSTMKKLLVLAACAFVLLAGTLRVTLVAQEAPPRFTLTVTGEPTASKEPDTPDAESAPDGVANEPDNATRQLTQDLVDVSRQGYEVALSAYSAQTAPLETVCEWSRRWLAAELELDPAPRAQVEHCQQHLTRMESLYQRVEKLQARGARGGEAERLALINYYVVLAKRELGKAETRVAAAPRLSGQATLVREEVITGNAPPPPPEPGDLPPLPEGVDVLSARYDGKSFDEWVAVLQQEISPERRAVAIEALCAFSAYDTVLANMAAHQIVLAMRTNRHWYLDNSKPGHMLQAALNAFNSIDREASLPVLIAALASDNDATRRFALQVFWYSTDATAEALPKLIELTKDPNAELRREALSALSRVDRKSPAIVAALADDDAQVVLAAMLILVPQTPTHGQFAGATAPPAVSTAEVVSALTRLAATAADGPIDQQVRIEAVAALGRLGAAASDALPVLENVSRVADPKLSQAAATAVEAILVAKSSSEPKPPPNEKPLE